MKAGFIIISFCIVLSSCSQTVKRQAHFLPLFGDKVLYSGSPYFIRQKDEVNYLTQDMKRAPMALVTRQPDGSVVVAWTSSKKHPEKLVYAASGIHPVEIPADSIKESRDLESDIPLGEPVVLSGFLPNTAFVRDIIDLRPISTSTRIGGPLPVAGARPANVR